jgi:hypothetical protein
VHDDVRDIKDESIKKWKYRKNIVGENNECWNIEFGIFC